MSGSRFSSSSASKAFAAGGTGVVVALLGSSQARAALTINRTATAALSLATSAAVPGGPWRTVFLDLDGNATNGAEAKAFAAAASWFKINRSVASLSFAIETGTMATYSGGTSPFPFLRPFSATPTTSVLSGASVNWLGGSRTLFDKGTGLGWSDWQGGGYVGFRIDQGGGIYSYGWLEITVNATGTEIAIQDWSAASASGGGGGGGGAAGGGGGEATGTPEPATSGLALLALGAAGVMRRRRQAA